MKKLALLFALLFATPAAAGVPCSLPFNLQNATIADATQVMANYNAIIICLGNAAAAGANNDITSLSALSTPITPAQGGTTSYVGTTSTGTNTQAVASTTPSTFALVAGRQIVFVVGSGNTGPTTLNVASSGPINLFRRSQLGVSAMVGGELVAGQPAVAVYDGTQYILMSAGPVQVGEIRNFAGTTAPLGWAFIDGSCQARTGVWADLFSVVSTAYDPTGSTCDSAHFALPDGRGRALVGLDNMGTNGAANRITSAGSGCTGTTIGGAGCGLQVANIAQAQLPSIALSFSGTPLGLHGHGPQGGGNFYTDVGVGGQFGSSGTPIGSVGSTAGVSAGTPAGSINPTNINGGVTQQGFVKLPPLQIVTQIIKL